MLLYLHYVNLSPYNYSRQLVPYYCKITVLPPQLATRQLAPTILGHF